MNDERTIRALLRLGTAVLGEAGIPEPVRDAKMLIGLAAERDKAFVIAHPEYEVTDEQAERFRGYLRRRLNREPIQHITGCQEFYRLSFAVTPDVMIPRPETELIVEAGVELLHGLSEPTICEVGVGSGCIVVSLLHALQNATASGLDISPAALRVAALNAERNRVQDRLTLLESNIFAALAKSERFDLIASNPPYVPAAEIESLQREVRDFEPHLALTDGGSGLTVIERIVTEAPSYLRPGGHLLLEIGFSQSEIVGGMFGSPKWQQIEFLPDLQGIPRIVKARFSNT